jgi:uncharacterized protein (TIGR02001 family)
MLRIVVASGLLLVATAAHAQANASVTVVSDDRYRGVSLSGDEPALQVGAGFDADSGLYVGGFASTAQLYGHDMVRWVGYVGRAGRFGERVSWDVGAQYTGFTDAPDDGWPEVYAGLAGDHLGARVAYARRYFGSDADALYTSVDAQQPLSRNVRLLAHAGWLHPMHVANASPAYDVRIGVGVHVDGFDLQLARTFLHADWADYRYAYPVGRDAAGDAWVIGITRRW